jgi:hypothetical protein
MRNFKKLMNIIFSIAVILSVSVQANIENCTSVYQVTATQLNVRNQASTRGKVIGALHKGDQVCLTQESGNWGKTYSGWVSKKHLQFMGTSSQNSVQSASSSTKQPSSDDDGRGMVIGLGILIVLAFIFFGLKTLFYHILISLGMAEPDGRAKNGIRLTRLGKFMASISGLIIFFIFMLIGSMSK